PQISTLSLHDALPISDGSVMTLEAVTFGRQERLSGSLIQQALYSLLPPSMKDRSGCRVYRGTTPGVLMFHTLRRGDPRTPPSVRSEEHTSELQSRSDL